MKVGFIGLGLMGKPMALNIHKKGFPLTVYNRTPNRAEEFKSLAGVKIAHSPAGVGEGTQVVVTIVTGPEDVKQVIFGEQVSLNL